MTIERSRVDRPTFRPVGVPEIVPGIELLPAGRGAARRRRGFAFASAASFLLVLVCVTAIGLLLRTVERPDGSTAFDAWVTSRLVGHRSDTLTRLARVLSAAGSQKALLPLVAVLVFVLLGRRHVLPAVLLALALGGATFLYILAKHFVGRPRPPEDLWLVRTAGKAFPSGHAAQATATFVAIAIGCAIRWPRLRWAMGLLALVLALGVGWSRVYLGVHWATDVIAGWLLAVAWVGSLVWIGRRQDGRKERARGVSRPRGWAASAPRPSRDVTSR